MTLNSEEVRGLSVAGVITDDTVWTLGDSPIHVFSDLTIARGAALRIDQGVEVRFETESSLIVNGSLYAVGTSDNPIEFVSNKSEPAAGDWNGVKFYGDENNTFTMSFCEVKYARDGITIASLGNAVVESSTITDNYLSGIHVIGKANLLIRKNTIRLNAKGISASEVTISGVKIIGNVIQNNENGIDLSAYGDKSRISNVTISNNVFRANTNGVYLHSGAGTGADAYINNVAISDNTVESGEHGIYLLADAYGEPGLLRGTCIYNSIISRNTIFSSRYAIYIDSSSSWWSWISGLNISGNIIHSCEKGMFMHAFRTPQPPYQSIPFDIALANNIISANDKGVEIQGDVTANFTGNSVSHNSHGIHLSSSVPSESVARNNDIYRNSAYGVSVVENALIKAEYNYWGAQSGPYHATLNPSGEGDRVDGNEENLDVMPFSIEPFGKINDPPFAVLKADETTVPVNQTVLFDGSKSTDDVSIQNYFFDFGDGATTSGFSGMARHKYASPGFYNVSLVVKDDLGVNSTNTAIETVKVYLHSLVISIFLNTLSVASQGNVTVEVHVSNGENSVSEVSVQLSSDQGGNFEPSSGYTDTDGNFESTFSVPSVSEPLNVKIVANASKENYKEDSDEVYLSVLPAPSGRTGSDISWFWLVPVIAVLAIAVATFIKKKRQRITADSSENESGFSSVCPTRRKCNARISIRSSIIMTTP